MCHKASDLCIAASFAESQSSCSCDQSILEKRIRQEVAMRGIPVISSVLEVPHLPCFLVNNESFVGSHQLPNPVIGMIPPWHWSTNPISQLLADQQLDLPRLLLFYILEPGVKCPSTVMFPSEWVLDGVNRVNSIHIKDDAGVQRHAPMLERS